MFFAQNGFSAYVEGIDTTDVNGEALDSAFFISTNKTITSNSLCAIYSPYGVDFYGNLLLLHYSFDDIKVACGNRYFNSNHHLLLPGTCFIIKKKDSTYTKIQILSKLADNRFIYKFGTNTTPNDSLFMNSDYDRSVRYKPNNLSFFAWYPEWGIGGDTTFWDPPAANNNHLLGYIVYESKSDVIIDTLAPINMTQWDSVFYINSTNFKGWVIGGFGYGCHYVNIVAVYSEGKSDFLQNFNPLCPSPIVETKSTPSVTNNSLPRMTLKRSPAGLTLDFHLLHENLRPLSIAIYTISGRQIVCFSNVNNGHFFWNISHSNVPEGTYIIKAVLPDRSILSQPFMLTK
jgi:hypothetical protein